MTKPAKLPPKPRARAKTVQITYSGTTETVELDQLVDFQGNLKLRTDEDIEKVVKSIARYGFSFPFFVWKDGALMKDSYNTVMGLFHGMHEVQNFRPGFAAWIHRKYAEPGGLTIDPCSGFGGRIVGWLVSQVGGKYLGFDPAENTHLGNKELISTLGLGKIVDVRCMPFEDNSPAEFRNKAGFAFTSPPYFSNEEYSYEATQSHVRYPDYEAWRDNFLLALMKIVYAWLKPGRIFALNIADVFIRGTVFPLFEDSRKLGKLVGFDLVTMETLKFSERRAASSMQKRSGKQNSEGVLIFKKPD